MLPSRLTIASDPQVTNILGDKGVICVEWEKWSTVPCVWEMMQNKVMTTSSTANASDDKKIDANENPSVVGL